MSDPELVPSLIVLACAPSLALAQKTPDLRIDDSPAGLYTAFEPVIASVGSTVYVAWEDTYDGGANQSAPRDVHFDRSLDGGRTWLPADVRLDTRLPAGTNWATGLSIDACDAAVYVAFADNPVGYALGYAEGIYLNRSLDEGSTWLPTEARIDHSTATSCGGTKPVVAAAGSTVYVAWLEDRLNAPNCFAQFRSVYLNRSLDGGLTWVPFDLRVDFDKSVNAADSEAPQLAAAGSAVHALWTDRRNGTYDLFYNRSLDNAVNWLAGAVRLDAGTTTSRDPRLAVDGSTVCAVWIESGTNDVRFNRSLDDGATWLAGPVPLGPGQASIFEPRLALDGSSVYVTWEGDGDVFFNRSLDGGTTWLPSALRIDTAPPNVRSRAPVVAAEGAAVLVAWTDDRNGIVTDAYANRSLDGGTTWLAADVRLDVGSPPGTGTATALEIAASGSSVYAVWEDERNGGTASSDLYFNLALGAQTYGAGTAGAGGFVPVLTASGTVSIGGSASVHVADALGGAPYLLVYSFAGPAQIASRFGTLLLQPPWSYLTLTLGGAAGVAGAGSGATASAIPNDVALLGTRVDLQAAVFDDAGPGRLALSNGLELWVL